MKGLLEQGIDSLTVLADGLLSGWNVNGVLHSLIIKGVFEGVETKILKVNRRNMRMQIEIPFAGRPVRTWVEYEVVKAVD